MRESYANSCHKTQCQVKNMPAALLMRMQKESYAVGKFSNQYVDHLSEDTVDTYMSLLSPELIKRFQQNIESPDVELLELPFATANDIERLKRAKALMAAWIRRRNSDQSCTT